MISLIYLVIIACVSAQAANVSISFSQSNISNGNMEKAYKKLDVAEEMIKSVKGLISNNIQALLPTDCEDLLIAGENKSGIYTVYLKNRIVSGPISVYCDMETDGGGWMVIQRRGDFLRENDYFHQDWKTYKKGFGNLKEDFWLGNDNIYALTNQRMYSIRFDLGTFKEEKGYALYNNFWIDDEYNNYRLHITGFSGNAGDSMALHNELKFTTKDRDNDLANYNCAQRFKGAWWFNACHPSNLHGDYHRGKPKDWEGLIWKTWKGFSESLRTTEMKIRTIRSWIK